MKRGFLSINAAKKNTPEAYQKRVVEKFARWKSPFLSEDRLKTLELLPAMQRERRFTKLINWADEQPDNLKRKYEKAIEKQTMKEQIAAQSAKIDESVYTDFLRWLCGNGTRQEKMWTPWANQPHPPALELPEVRKLFDDILDEMSRAEKKMTILALRGPQSLHDYWLWYKFMIHVDDEDMANPWAWLDMVPPPEPEKGGLQLRGPVLMDGINTHDTYIDKYRKDAIHRTAKPVHDPPEFPDIIPDAVLDEWSGLEENRNEERRADEQRLEAEEGFVTAEDESTETLDPFLRERPEDLEKEWLDFITRAQAEGRLDEELDKLWGESSE